MGWTLTVAPIADMVSTDTTIGGYWIIWVPSPKVLRGSYRLLIRLTLPKVAPIPAEANLNLFVSITST